MASSMRSISLRRSPSAGVPVWGGFVIAGDTTSHRPGCQAMPGLAATGKEGVDIQASAGIDGEDAGMVDVSIEIQSALSVPETVTAGGAVEIDYQKGTFQRLVLAGDVTSMSIIGWPRSGKTGRLILQVTNTGLFEINGWPVTTLWAGGGVDPVITKGVGKRDLFVFTSADGGVELFADVVGQDYAT